MTVETIPTGPSEEEIQQRIQSELEAARIQREKDLEEEHTQIAREIEEDIRGRPGKQTKDVRPTHNSASDLTEEERASIFTAPEFLDFVEQSTKVVQRALSDAYDYTKDYSIGADAGT